MKLKTIHILLAGIIITCGTSASAAVLDDVRDLINAGQYAEALDLAAPVLKRSPRDAKTNYWYGRAALGAGDTDEALRTLAVAAERGYTDAYAPLIETALAVYDTDLASESIDDWRTALKKVKKPSPMPLPTSKAVMCAWQMPLPASKTSLSSPNIPSPAPTWTISSTE